MPADALHGRDHERYSAILPLVDDIGCNALRVWGGGVYETDEFYEWCDLHGIMVWQDFMMACGVYPLDERLEKEYRTEFTSVIKRLRRFECIILWAGDNECDQSYAWNEIKHDPNKNQITRRILPDILNSEDWTRPYIPSSPYISEEAYLAGAIENTTEQHMWGPRDYYKSNYYHHSNAVFASEMGYHGCPSPISIKKFISTTSLWPPQENDEWLLHSASPETSKDALYIYRINLMTNQIFTLFSNKPKNLEEYAYMSQISQAEAMKTFIETFRSRKWDRTGIIWWNIMDCWPQFSDAVVDYFGCKKLAYFFIKRAQAPLYFMIDDQKDEDYALYANNDLLVDTCVEYKILEVDTECEIIRGSVTVPAEAAVRVASLCDIGKERHFYYIEWIDKNGEKGSTHYLAGLPKFDYGWYRENLKKCGFDEFEGFK